MEIYDWRGFEHNSPETYTPERDGTSGGQIFMDSNGGSRTDIDIPHPTPSLSEISYGEKILDADGNVYIPSHSSNRSEFDEENMDNMVGRARRGSVRIGEEDLVV